jgi:hypothetical protein
MNSQTRTLPQLSSSDLRLVNAINLLFEHRIELTDFFFTPCRSRLRLPQDQLQRHARSLCQSDELIIRIALGIWNDSGTIIFSELYEKLDQKKLSNVMTALENLSRRG